VHGEIKLWVRNALLERETDVFYCKKNLPVFNEIKKTGRIKNSKELHNQPLLLQPKPQ